MEEVYETEQIQFSICSLLVGRAARRAHSRSNIFNEQTLHTNKCGILTEQQRLYLREHSEGSTKAALILVPLSILMVLVMAYYVFTKDGRVLNPIEVKIFLYGVLSCVAISVLWFLFNLKIWAKNRPCSAFGVAKYKVEEIFDSSDSISLSGNSYIYKIKIGRTTFILNSSDDMHAFTEGKKYKVYYIPITGHKMILSAEAL